jgi:hypothetical protein
LDPMIDFVRERTTDLQRTAETVRRDRELRQMATATPAASAATTLAGEPITAPVLATVATSTGQRDDPCQGVACAQSGVRHAA